MLWNNPDPELKAPKELLDLLPEFKDLRLEVRPSPRFGPQYGHPGSVVLGVPRDPANPKLGDQQLVCSRYVGAFEFGYMPNCCGVGLVRQIGTAEMNPAAWEKLFDLVLPKNPHMMYIPIREGFFEEIHRTLEGVGKTIAVTRNKVHDTVIEHRMWTPPKLNDYFFDTEKPPYHYRNMIGDHL